MITCILDFPSKSILDGTFELGLVSIISSSTEMLLDNMDSSCGSSISLWDQESSSSHIANAKKWTNLLNIKCVNLYHSLIELENELFDKF